MADNYLAGKQASVDISSISYSFEEWVAEMKVNDCDITNFTSGGYRALLMAIVSCDITLEGPYNEGNMAFTVGQSYTFVLTYESTVTLTVSAYVVSITPTVNAKKEQRIKIVAHSSGSFTASLT